MGHHGRWRPKICVKLTAKKYKLQLADVEDCKTVKIAKRQQDLKKGRTKKTKGLKKSKK